MGAGHSHGHSHDHTDSNKRPRWVSNLINLGISIVLLLLLPPILNLFFSSNVQKLEEQQQKYSSDINFVRAKVVSTNLVEEIKDDFSGLIFLNSNLNVEITEGYAKGDVVDVFAQVTSNQNGKGFREGDVVVLRVEPTENGLEYYYIDRYRVNSIVFLIFIFIIFVLILAGLQGATALVNLYLSIIVLVNFLIPGILFGQNILLITFITGVIIMTLSLLLSQGFSRTTFLALVASLTTITIATLASIWVVDFSKLTGASSEESVHLQTTGITSLLNLKDLLLSAIIIGTLGVLDDITISQVALVKELHLANPKLTFMELFKRGMAVGRSHIVSIVNTLAYAYVGAALPLLILFSVYNSNPLWVTLNNQEISEEIIRTLVGSFALLMAMPLATLLAAKFVVPKEGVEKEVSHSH